MKRLIGLGASAALLLSAATVSAQTPQTSPSTKSEDTQPGLPTASGTTGIWFVPTADVLPARAWSVSLGRTNIDDGQGFSDISTFPLTFAMGVAGRAELFGSWATVVRVDRDTRPLFFTSTPTGQAAGTGGGILPDYPLIRQQWTGNKIGDLSVGGKISLVSMQQSPVGVALRAMAKLPVGDSTIGTSSGKADFQVDGILSASSPIAELSGYGGVIVRGNPDGYQLTNGLRWGVGAVFPLRDSLGFRVTAELFGEKYFNNTITSPAGQFGSDNSAVPTTTELRSPAVMSLGLTWQAPGGFFVGGAASWNLHMDNRSAASISCSDPSCVAAPFSDTPKDDKGLQIRIGFHPGARSRTAQSPSASLASGAAAPAAAAPAGGPGAAGAAGGPGAGNAAAAAAAPAPSQPADRPPVVRATCDPCSVEAGHTATLSADAQDPDGDPLTYRWTATAGSLANPTSRQTPWTAPMQTGPVQVSVAVSDGRGGTASNNLTMQVIAPRTFTFEDVHFEFDRYSLRPDALHILDDAVTAMKANPNLRLEIEGHTCNIGTAEYNLALGERRARAVRDYLTSRGIAADRLHTISYGEERPQYDNSREETRRLNRRAALAVRMQ